MRRPTVLLLAAWSTGVLTGCDPDQIASSDSLVGEWVLVRRWGGITGLDTVFAEGDRRTSLTIGADSTFSRRHLTSSEDETYSYRASYSATLVSAAEESLVYALEFSSAAGSDSSNFDPGSLLDRLAELRKGELTLSYPPDVADGDFELYRRLD